MSYWTNKLTEQDSLIGRPCWYQKPYNTDITFGLIKEVQVRQNSKGKEAIATLDNGTTAVLHTMVVRTLLAELYGVSLPEQSVKNTGICKGENL